MTFDPQTEISRLDRAVNSVQNAIEVTEKELGSVDKKTDGLLSNLSLLASRLGTLEIAVAKHSGICDERYLRINDHMTASSLDRAEMRKMIRNMSGTIIILLLGVVGYLLSRFGLPPALHP